MAIIDEKGRLFKKLNIIDLLLILFLLCLIPAFYLGFKILNETPLTDALKSEFIEMEINCKLIKLQPEKLKLISVGDKEIDETNNEIGKIVSLGQSTAYKYEFDIGEDQKLIKEDPMLRQIEAKLKLSMEVKQDTPYYKDKEIRIGSPLEFKTDKYDLLAVPLEETKENSGKEIISTIYVKFKNLFPEIVESIKQGDKQYEINENIMDENNR